MLFPNIFVTKYLSLTVVDSLHSYAGESSSFPRTPGNLDKSQFVDLFVMILREAYKVLGIKKRVLCIPASGPGLDATNIAREWGK